MPPSYFTWPNEGDKTKKIREFLVILSYREKKKDCLWGGVYSSMLFEQMVCLNCLQSTTKKVLRTRF